MRHGEERRSRVSNHALNVLLALTLAACASAPAAPPPPTEPRPFGPGVEVISTPVPLNPSDPKQEKIGNFVYAGGVQLTSNQTGQLHGLSDLKILPDGTLVAISDEGSLFKAKLKLDGHERLVGLDEATLEPLKGLDGKGLQGKDESDAEGVAVMPGGDLLVSFERDDRIWRYPPAGLPPAPAPKPNTLLSFNEGMEALSPYPVAGANAYLVGSEEGDIWLCRLSSSCVSTPALTPPGLEFGLTGIAAFDGPAIALLYRAYDPIRGARAEVRFVREPLRAKPAPQIIDSFRIDGALTRDNFEGLAIVSNSKGGTRVYILSDDNVSAMQRTLLLAFDWVPPK
jgi:hypothetical protein